MPRSRLYRSDFSGGWNPNADHTNCANNELLRMDNLIIDEQNIVSLRKGSSILNRTGLAGGTYPVRSLYTAYQSIASVRTKIQFAYCGGNVYKSTDQANFTALTSGWDETLDAQFTNYLGFTYYTAGSDTAAGDGSKHKRYDGTTVGTWGLASPTTKPALTSAAQLTQLDGAINNSVTTIVVDSGASIVNGWIITCESENMYVVSGQDTTSIVVIRGWNGTTAAAHADNTAITAATVVSQLNGAIDDIETTITLNDASRVTQWMVITIDSEQLQVATEPAGNTFDVTRGVNGTTAAAHADATVVTSPPGGIDGSFNYVYRYVRNESSFNTLSGPSPVNNYVSSSTMVQVTFANPTDTSVDQVWIYRIGGTLDNYYLVKKFKVTSWAGNGVYVDGAVDADILTLNEQLEDSGVTYPPDNIIGLSEDYYTRVFGLTSDGLLYPSKRGCPEMFYRAQALTVCGAGEVPYWVHKGFGGLYIGTSKDIYRIDGTGAEFADGTIDLTITPLNVNAPPISVALAYDGNVLIYLAKDGWRLFTGQISELITGNTSLLYQGYVRHNIQPVNITNSASRFRAAIHNGILYCITPEGTATTSTSVVYKYVISEKRWYRHYYGYLDSGIQPNYLTSIYSEPGGRILSGNFNGKIYGLNELSADDLAQIPFTIWTKFDDDGKPLQRKDPKSIMTQLDSHPTTCGIAGYVNQTGQIDTPPAPSVEVFGTPGATTYYYWCFASSVNPWTPFSRSGISQYTKITNSNAVLDGSNFNILRAQNVGAGYSYTFLRTTTPTITDGHYSYYVIDGQNVDSGLAYDTSNSLDAADVYVQDTTDGSTQVFNKTLGDPTEFVTTARDGRFRQYNILSQIELVDGIDIVIGSWIFTELQLKFTGTSTLFRLYSYSVEYEECPKPVQGHTEAYNFGTYAKKIVSGLKVRACPYVHTVVGGEQFTKISAFADGVVVPLATGGTTLTVPMENNGDAKALPSDFVLQFDAPVTAKEFLVKVDRPTEIYSIDPADLYVLPIERSVWNSGPVDFPGDQEVWIRKARVKLMSANNFKITVSFDGVPKSSITVTIVANKITTYEIYFPRGYKGREVSVQIEAATISNTFHLWWVELFRMGSGNDTEKVLSLKANNE